MFPNNKKVIYMYVAMVLIPVVPRTKYHLPQESIRAPISHEIESGLQLKSQIFQLLSSSFQKPEVLLSQKSLSHTKSTCCK